MPIVIAYETGNVYRLEIGGRLTPSELAPSESELAGVLHTGGSARLLCVASSFDGWHGRGWQNIASYPGPATPSNASP